MSITLKDAAAANVVYNLHRTDGPRAVYHGPLQTDLINDHLILTANPPTRTRDSYGNRRSSAKTIKTVSVPSVISGETQSKDARVDIVTSIPVGMDSLEVMELFARSAELAASAYLSDLALTGKTQA